MWLMNWIKAYGAKKLIQEMDVLEPILEDRLKEAQEKFGAIPPKEFSKQLVDEIQLHMCQWIGIDPDEILKEK